MSSFIILCIGFKNFSLFFKNILWRLKIEHFCKCLQWWIKHKFIWVARLSVKHCCIDSLSISYFKIKSKLTYMYFFMILSDFSAIRSNQLSFFFDKCLYDYIYYDEYSRCFLAMRVPLTAFLRWVNGGIRQSISYSSPFSKSINLSILIVSS